MFQLLVNSAVHDPNHRQFSFRFTSGLEGVAFPSSNISLPRVLRTGHCSGKSNGRGCSASLPPLNNLPALSNYPTPERLGICAVWGADKDVFLGRCGI